jgi:hypothetical protein
VNQHRLAFLALALVVSLVLAQSTRALDATVAAILNNPAQFDGTVVAVKGNVSATKATVSRKGNRYFTFDLNDGGRTIRIFSFGNPTCPDGSWVTVTGTFNHVKRVGRYTFHDELSAERILCS